LCILAAACGNEETVIKETVFLPESESEIDVVSEIVQEYNDYMELSGQAIITPGLICRLYDVSGPKPASIPANPSPLVSTYTYIGEFNQPVSNSSIGLNILPNALRSVYKQWFVVRCQGYLVVPKSDYYLFRLTSDDGSILRINNVVVVDNDGNHATQTVSGQRLLQRGVHSFRLDYMQGPGGEQSLILDDGTNVIPAKLFYK
jgi:hypothetical protein